MVVIQCPSCLGRFGGPFRKTAVMMGDGVVEFSCETCKGRGRVEVFPDGSTKAIPDILDAIQNNKNAYFASHPEIFVKRRSR